MSDIILLGAEKGGVGKSTLSVNLAIALALDKADVLFVDSDPQRTGSKFFEARNELEILPRVTSIEKLGKGLHKELPELAKRYEHIIVDTGGRDAVELRSAMLVCDLLIVPTQPGQFDVETFEKMEEIVSLVPDEINVLAVINRASPNPVVNEHNEAKEFLSEYDFMRLSDNVIRDRKAWRDAARAGQGIVELDNEQAKNEFLALYREVYYGE